MPETVSLCPSCLSSDLEPDTLGSVPAILLQSLFRSLCLHGLGALWMEDTVRRAVAQVRLGRTEVMHRIRFNSQPAEL
jgi:hypothetical protein